MAEYDDLKKQLRRCDGHFDISPDLHGEAADAIEALENQVKTVLKREVDAIYRHDATIEALERERDEAIRRADYYDNTGGSGDKIRNAAIEEAAKVAESADPEKPSNWLHRREDVAYAIRKLKRG